MSRFIIEGGYTLSGEIAPQGAKNEALQVISATLLTDRKVTISNIPEILDVRRLIDLLRAMNVEVCHLSEGVYTFCAANIDVEYTATREFVNKAGELRGSVLVVGPLLSRFGRALFPKPGGDQIGRRKIDTHVDGFIKLGARCEYDHAKGAYLLSVPDGKRLRGTYMLLDEASVTGTANIIMAAALAQGTTTIYNAACEPYVQQLCRMLMQMGLHIEGLGSNLLTIHGRDSLLGAQHTILPDMIELGSFIGMAAMNRSPLRIKDVSVPNLGIIPASFRRLGVDVTIDGDDIVIPAQDHLVIDTALDGSILTVADAPWPGLTPDLLSVMLVVATQCQGSVLIHQKMFESRLFFVDRLIDMGAQITLCDPHRAVVIGLDHRYELRPNNMSSPDIRAGIALLIAAMSANGTSTIGNINQIDRGYERIDERLRSIGAHVWRED